MPELTPRRSPHRPFGIGLNVPYVEGSLDGETPRWADIRAMATTAEDVGFDAVWISDHVGFGDPTGDWRGAWECWTLLAAVAAITERVHVGPYVTPIPFRNPALLAKMAETLDEVSGGRAILGVGAGWNEPEFRAYDFPWERKFDRFEDALRIIASMLRTGEATHDGLARAEHARIQPRGPRPEGLPIVVGAGGPRMLRLTAELADDWNAGLTTADELPDALARLEAACEAVGRDPATLSRSAEVLVRPIARDGDPPAEDREIRGAPAAIAQELRRFAELGIGHLQVQLRPNRPDSVAAFGAVLEALDGPA